ncbi:hypothetical protein DRQ29_05205 [bacterium]|nr:MAG: hypothetical protein DRQ29_05205 [bacterium]
MGLLTEKESLRMKLSTIPLPVLKKFVKNFGNEKLRRSGDIIKFLIQKKVSNEAVDKIIKDEYEKKLNQRKSVISDQNLLKELLKVKKFHWGVVQGQLDNKIQVRYVRKYFKYNELIRSVENSLYTQIRNYVVCSWYNYWTTVIIEDMISGHPNVIPTLKNVKGVDLFFKNQPFDLKITYLPDGYSEDIKYAIENPKDIIIWLYEHQGAQRFGADNRLFVILYDTKNPDESWKIKRDVKLIRSRIDEFFTSEIVSEDDEIIFTFGKKTYTVLSKLLFILK